MTESEKKNRPGRPYREFDAKLIKNLAANMCTIDEIEAMLEADQRTIDGWFQRELNESFYTFYKRHAKVGSISLRRIQFNLAKKNAAMAIWLGKQYLGQRDIDKERDNLAEMIKVSLRGSMQQEQHAQCEPEISVKLRDERD